MKIDRLFAITNFLLDKKTVTASWLAGELGVSVRTIYRDMDILAANGVPVYTTKGQKGGISLMENFSMDKTLLSDKEQRQILMALKGMEATRQFDVKEPLIKLNGIFQKKDVDWIEIDFSSWEQSDDESKKFQCIREGIEREKVLSFGYHDSNGNHTNRKMEPLKLVFKGYSWYVYGYCLIHQDYHFFKLLRMEDVKLETETVKNQRPEKSECKYIRKEQMVTYTLRVDKKLQFRVNEELQGAKIKNEKENLLVETVLPDSKWLFGYFCGFGTGLEILSPKQKRQEYKDYLEEILKKYL